MIQSISYCYHRLPITFPKTKLISWITSLPHAKSNEVQTPEAYSLTCPPSLSLLVSLSLLLELPVLAPLGDLRPNFPVRPSMSGLLVLWRSLFLPLFSPFNKCFLKKSYWMSSSWLLVLILAILVWKSALGNIWPLTLCSPLRKLIRVKVSSPTQ